MLICSFTCGLIGKPVWKISLGLSFAIAPKNSSVSKGGTEKYNVAAKLLGNA